MIRILTVASWLALTYDLLLLAGVLETPQAASFGMERLVEWLAAVALAGLTWMLIGALNFRVLTHGLQPGLIFSLSVAAVAVSLISASSAVHPWPVIVPIVLAPLLAAYLYTGNSILASLTIAVSLVPWPRFVQFVRHR